MCASRGWDQSQCYLIWIPLIYLLPNMSLINNYFTLTVIFPLRSDLVIKFNMPFNTSDSQHSWFSATAYTLTNVILKQCIQMPAVYIISFLIWYIRKSHVFLLGPIDIMIYCRWMHNDHMWNQPSTDVHYA